jgi:hypothetical protein
VELRVDLIEVMIDSTSLREDRRAATSLAARGVTAPVTTGPIMSIVVLRLVAMLLRKGWIAGPTEPVLSVSTTEAARLLTCSQ